MSNTLKLATVFNGIGAVESALRYQTTELQTRKKTYTDRTAQIIQHEVYHCNGILI